MNAQDAATKLIALVPALITLLTSILRGAAGFVVIILLAGTAFKELDLDFLRWMPSMGTTELAYLCGAWWLAR